MLLYLTVSLWWWRRWWWRWWWGDYLAMQASIGGSTLGGPRPSHCLLPAAWAIRLLKAEHASDLRITSEPESPTEPYFILSFTLLYSLPLSLSASFLRSIAWASAVSSTRLERSDSSSRGSTVAAVAPHSACVLAGDRPLRHYPSGTAQAADPILHE